MNTTGRELSLFWAALRQRCPVCRRGPLFRTLTVPHERCPVCGIRFEREPGYFLGAMYVSYFLAVIILGGFFLVSRALLPEASSLATAAVAAAFYLPLVPLVFRYSRVVWLYFDYWAWPRPSA